MSRGARILRNLRAGGATFRISLVEGLQYRFAALSGSVVGIFWGLIEITVLRAFFLYGDNAGAAGVGGGMILPQAVSYIWLAQAFYGIQAGVDFAIIGKIDSGDQGVELCRPMSLYINWFCLNMGKRLAPLVWRGIPILLFGLVMPLAYRLQGPASFWGLLSALLALAAACLLSCAWLALVFTVRMNVQWGNGPMQILMLISQLLSGAFLPLQLWPAFLQKLLLFQPFAGIIDLPARLYLGLLQPGDVLWTTCLQLLWAAVFIGIGARLMKRRLKTIVVQGG